MATTEPLLVEITPGVWVIEDYNEPVFYTDGYYWLYRDDGWFRSSVHTGGWIHVPSAPTVVVSIGRPRAYVHYRAPQGVRVRNGPRGSIIVRDHRDDGNRPPGRRDDRDGRDDRGDRDGRDDRPAPRGDDRTLPARQPDRAAPPDERAHPPGDRPARDDKPGKPADKAKPDDKPGKPDDKARSDDKPGKPDDKPGKPDDKPGKHH